MSKIIDCVSRQQVLTILANLSTAGDRGVIFAAADVAALPGKKMEEVKHGTWKFTPDGAAYCTSCKQKMNPFLYGYLRCPMCGSYMNADINDGGTSIK